MEGAPRYELLCPYMGPPCFQSPSLPCNPPRLNNNNKDHDFSPYHFNGNQVKE